MARRFDPNKCSDDELNYITDKIYTMSTESADIPGCRSLDRSKKWALCVAKSQDKWPKPHIFQLIATLSILSHFHVCELNIHTEGFLGA